MINHSSRHFKVKIKHSFTYDSCGFLTNSYPLWFVTGFIHSPNSIWKLNKLIYWQTVYSLFQLFIGTKEIFTIASPKSRIKKSSKASFFSLNDRKNKETTKKRNTQTYTALPSLSFSPAPWSLGTPTYTCTKTSHSSVFLSITLLRGLPYDRF